MVSSNSSSKEELQAPTGVSSFMPARSLSSTCWYSILLSTVLVSLLGKVIWRCLSLDMAWVTSEIHGRFLGLLLMHR